MKKITLNTDDLIRLYETGKSITKVAEEFGVSGSTVIRRLAEIGYQIRPHGLTHRISTAAKYGDLSEPIRRYIAGETMIGLAREYGIDHRRLEMAVTAAGHPLRTIGQALGLRYTRMSVSERRSVTAKANIAVRGQKRSIKSQERRARTLQNTLQLASRTDLLLCVWLTQRAISITPQKAIGVYNVDIAVEEALVAIEVNGGWHYFEDRPLRDTKRREYLFSQGWRVIDVQLTRQDSWKYLRPSCADKIVSLLKEARSPKSTWGQHCVIGGDGELLARPCSEPHHGAVIVTAADAIDVTGPD